MPDDNKDQAKAITATLPVNELRDYHLINRELKILLDRGATRVRLTGVEGQRLLLEGLAGPWSAIVTVEGWVGPEFAAGLDAAGLTVVVSGGAADGLGRSVRGGSIVVMGDAGAAAGYRLEGGRVVVAGASGPRAGLEQGGGQLILAGPTGALAGERQRGGLLVLLSPVVGPDAGRGRSGGAVLRAGDADADRGSVESYRKAVVGLRDWLPPTIGLGTWRVSPDDAAGA
jgi:glutamate synthase domain-containing protein 3